jgi:hypothetical protein
MIRLLALRILSLALSCFVPMVARAACPSVIDGKTFSAHGGKLVPAGKAASPDLPPDFFCDRPACPGAVTFETLLDETGHIRIVKTLSNSFQIEPEKHAAIVASMITGNSYEPPQLDGKSVCVRMQMRMVFSEDGK